MKRYEPDIEWFHGYEPIPEPTMVETPDGDYVKYSDVKELLKEFIDQDYWR